MLDIAVGVFAALAAMRLVDHLLVLHRDSRRVRLMKEELSGAADNFIDKMHAEMKAEQAAEAAKTKPKRRTNATKATSKRVAKATNKATPKVAAKKGVKNVRRTNR